MEPRRLSQLVAAARAGDSAAREELLAFHRPFIHQVACRVAGRSLHWENDDELSVALLAFNEAIDQYEGRGGAGFLTYATTVIRHRLLDHYRRESRAPRPAGLAAGRDEETPVAPAEIREAWARYEVEEEERATAAEIDLLIHELSQYGITLADLVTSSPRHRDTKATLLRVVRTLLSQPDLVAEFRRTRQLPVKELVSLTGVHRKVLERGRRYIVAVAVVMLHPDLPRIRGHIRLPELQEVIAHG